MQDTIKSNSLMVTSSLAVLALAIPAPQAQVRAQALTPVVDVCTGVSLDQSAVRDLLVAVNQPIVSPLQTTVNGLLGILLPPLSIDVTGIVNTAIAGNPLTVDVLATDGTIVGPGTATSRSTGLPSTPRPGWRLAATRFPDWAMVRLPMR